MRWTGQGSAGEVDGVEARGTLALQGIVYPYTRPSNRRSSLISISSGEDQEMRARKRLHKFTTSQPARKHDLTTIQI